MNEQEMLQKMKDKAKELNLETVKSTVANMEIETTTVTDPVIKSILKNIKLSDQAQQEVMDKLLERTPNYNQLSGEEQVGKITTALTMETVIEFLRLTEYVKGHVTMLESGINNEGSVIVTAYYINENEVAEKVFNEELTEEQVEQMEREINLFNSEVDIYAEAKKRVEQMGQVVPFQNRSQRRIAKAQARKKGVTV